MSISNIAGGRPVLVRSGTGSFAQPSVIVGTTAPPAGSTMISPIISGAYAAPLQGPPYPGAVRTVHGGPIIRSFSGISGTPQVVQAQPVAQPINIQPIQIQRVQQIYADPTPVQICSDPAPQVAPVCAPICGGINDEMPPDDEVKAVVEEVKAEIEKRIGNSLPDLAVVSYRTQTVAGFNYFVKCRAGGEFLQAMIFKGLGGVPASLEAVKMEPGTQ
eukprot:gnl/MRDRNA2_/MRDRNA2_143608_c0_seq1.p1 gnl/MRDRNA2_/MRDRNA2_143608_c0~~gnl/MRDRNA2_/MRDRNA2_143608_c0_seq1.p1  ORF type:complete len:217 (-),score=36.18 gnl/MRDRNA2_/MRDRNA2_143608_c0_seq1:47-697(-)